MFSIYAASILKFGSVITDTYVAYKMQKWMHGGSYVPEEVGSDISAAKNIFSAQSILEYV